MHVLGLMNKPGLLWTKYDTQALRRMGSKRLQVLSPNPLLFLCKSPEVVARLLLQRYSGAHLFNAGDEA